MVLPRSLTIALLACFAVLAPVNASSDRIVFHTLKTLALARMDPIISPGNMSQQYVSYFLTLLEHSTLALMSVSAYC